MQEYPIISLTPPQLTEHHIKEKISCIRAHRERIFNTSLETIANKTIIHNYGHGGAGWTFLFGSVNTAIRLFEQTLAQDHLLKNEPITVIGAGCYGLLTAIILTLKGHKVRVVAHEIKDIPSHKAAGFFFPRHRKCSNEQEKAVFESIGMESYATYLAIINSTHQFITKGALLLPSYFGLDIDPGFAPYIAQGFMDQPRSVMIDFGNGKKYPAMEYHTVFINAAVIMNQLHELIIKHSIPIITQTVHSFGDIDEKIIFNCAGLGARYLTHDKRIVPVQGHLITLNNQCDMNALQYMINMKVVMTDEHGKSRDELIYFSPKDNGILGITFIRGQENPHANTHEFDRLLKRCRDFFGS